MFDAVSTVYVLPPTDVYYDCIEHVERDTTLEPKIFLQWLNHLEQQNQVNHVNFVSGSTPDLVFPTPCSYSTMLTGGLNLL